MVSCLAANHRFVYEAMARYLDARLDVAVRFDSEHPWEECLEMLYDGRAQLGMLCGLPYAVQPLLQIVVAPVMKAPRYAGQPVYFTDVMVRADSRFRSFEDLRGASWAYNEPNSHSGYNVVRAHLAHLGETSQFFSRIVASGAHSQSLQMLLRGEIDAVSLDTTFFDLEAQADPSLVDRVRVVQVLGPSPIQPFLAHRSVPEGLRLQMTEVLTQMHLEPFGQAILETLPVERFVALTDADYDPIRVMLKAAESV